MADLSGSWSRPDRELRSSARLVALLRILFLVLAVAVLGTLRSWTEDEPLLWLEAIPLLQVVAVVVAVVTFLLTALVPWVRHRWQLLASLVFDLAWMGTLIHLTGGVASPIVSLLPAVVLTSSLVLPGPGHVILPLIGAGLLGASTVAYLLGVAPFDVSGLPSSHPLLYPPRVIGNLVVQIGALFLVDVLGQALARRLHEERLVTGGLIDQLAEGVVAVDRDGRVLYGNPAAAAFLTVPEVRPGMAIARVLAAPFLEPVRQAWEEQGVPFGVRFDGPYGRSYQVRGSRLIGRRGRMVGSTLLISDETRLRELERDANRAERLASLGEMAAGIAHEVRNPLASLRGCAQELSGIARSHRQDDESALADIILTESDRLGILVNDFLSLSRLRTPGIVGVDLAEEFIGLEILTCRGELPTALDLCFVVADDVPWIAADPGQLRQVVTNLVRNAIDAVARVPQPQVSVRAYLTDDPAMHDGQGVAICVNDNGPGIPAEKVEEIFTPFYSTKGQGTGLGLTMVSRIVEAHAGRILVHSEKDVGTEITAVFPIWREGIEEMLQDDLVDVE